MPEERLQKILSQAGIASRRRAEEMIETGQVTVNDQLVTTLGSKADLSRDSIKVNGRLLKPPKRLVYIALNKPKGCVTTVSDPEGRPTVMDLLHGVKERVFPVGRLDYASEGLLLFTNDGEFAHRLTAPASHLMKTYQVKVNGPLSEAQEEAFRAGVPLHGRKTAPAEIQRVKHGANPWYEVKIGEGRQNQIRMMFRHFGRLVEKLRRTKIGFMAMDLAPGRYRLLTDREIDRFRRELGFEEGALAAGATAAETAVNESVSESAAASAAAPQENRPSRTPGGFSPVRRPAGGPKRSTGGARKPPAKRSGGFKRSDGSARGSSGYSKSSSYSKSSGFNKSSDFKRTGSDSRATGSDKRDSYTKRPSEFGDRDAGRPPAKRPAFKRPAGTRPPAKRFDGARSDGARPPAKRFDGARSDGARPPAKRFDGARPGGTRPGGTRPSGTRPDGDRPGVKRPFTKRPAAKRPFAKRPSSGGPAGGRPSGARPTGSRPPAKRFGGPKRAGGPKRTGGPAQRPSGPPRKRRP